MWQPMLLTEAPDAFDRPDWLWQLKFDGVRCMMELDAGRVLMSSRNLREMTSRFPEVTAAVTRAVAANSAVLDGELICLSSGKPDFYKVMGRLHSRGDRIAQGASTAPASFMAFDILHINGRDCIGLPLVERQEILKSQVRPTDQIQLVESYPGTSGLEVARAVAAMDLEGVVGKRTDSVYRPGARSRDWVKVKFWQRSEVTVLGVNKHPFSAVVGDADGKVWCSVTLGLNEDRKRALWEAIPLLKLRETGGVVWLRPVLRCRIRYRSSPAGLIREPVFDGFLLEQEEQP